MRYGKDMMSWQLSVHCCDSAYTGNEVSGTLCSAKGGVYENNRQTADDSEAVPDALHSELIALRIMEGVRGRWWGCSDGVWAENRPGWHAATQHQR